MHLGYNQPVEVVHVGLYPRSRCKGGWANEIRPQDCVHTLIAVFTDESIAGGLHSRIMNPVSNRPPQDRR